MLPLSIFTNHQYHAQQSSITVINHNHQSQSSIINHESQLSIAIINHESQYSITVINHSHQSQSPITILIIMIDIIIVPITIAEPGEDFRNANSAYLLHILIIMKWIACNTLVLIIVIRHHSSSFVIIRHHSSSFVIIRHHSSSFVITRYVSLPIVFNRCQLWSSIVSVLRIILSFDRQLIFHLFHRRHSVLWDSSSVLLFTSMKTVSMFRSFLHLSIKYLTWSLIVTQLW